MAGPEELESSGTDTLRNKLGAAEYKRVVLGLIFLKYLSDTVAEHRAKLITGKGEYRAENVSGL
jgi:type I restriction-modification system DNA methylase subunit